MAELAVLNGESLVLRELPDGTVFDLTDYDRYGVLLSFQRDRPDEIQFIDFVIYPS